MPDLLVKLYTLPPVQPLIDSLASDGFTVRRAIAPEKHVIAKWIGEHFGAAWVSETEVSFSNHPVSCWIVTYDKRCAGFACYDATARGFFGPTGVDETYRGKGLGKALLLACLHDMHNQGYGYGIIGGAGPVEFYAKAVGATVIPDSWPGIYEGMLREDGKEEPE
jgi:GNAT superfamily N-acetyltransferase